MRVSLLAVLLVTILVALLVVGVLLASPRGVDEDPDPRDGPTRASESEEHPFGPSEAAVSPPPLSPEPPRLAGAVPRSPSVPVEPKPSSPFLPPPLLSGPEHVARMLRDGTRTERLWGEYVREAAPPTFQRWIAHALARLDAGALEARWARLETSLPGRVALRLRLLRADPGLWRDIGVDTRDLGHLYLDDTEVEVVERVLARGLDRLGLEDEFRLSVATGAYEDCFLRATAPWPRRPTGGTLPLGALVRVRPVVSADRRYLTLQLRLRMAVPAGAGEGHDSDGDVTVRTCTSAISMPDGCTMLLIAREAVWDPHASRRPSPAVADDAARYILMLQAVLE